MAGLETIVLERHRRDRHRNQLAQQRGDPCRLYYPAGSLKARLCMASKQFLYRYCADRGVAHARCGKLIVATDEGQRATLATIRANAAGLGMPDLEPWTGAGPGAGAGTACTAALWSPMTGIIDSHSLMLAYQADAERGAVVALESARRAEPDGDGIVLEVGGAAPMQRARVSSSTAPASPPRPWRGAFPAATRPGCRARITAKATITASPDARPFAANLSRA